MADQKPPVRHHYVPKMLLKRFTDSNSQLWTFNKACPEMGVLPKSITSVFIENHRYSLTRADGSKDPWPEHYMAPIEGEADKFIEKVVETVRGGKTPVITSSEHALWNEFLRVQWLRRPDIVAANMSGEEFDDFLDAKIEALASMTPRISEQDLRTVQDPKWRHRMKRNVAAQLVTQPLELVQSTLAHMGLAIAIIRKPNKSFVIGSHPMIRCAPPGGGRLGAPGVEFWLPIAKDVAISPLPEPGRVHVMDGVPDVDLRRLNLAIFNQSREVASSSRNLIESLATARG